MGQAAERRKRLSSYKVTKKEATTNPEERGREGLTRRHKIGAQGIHDDIYLSGGTFTKIRSNKKNR